MRVLFIQPRIPSYRKPFFNQLFERLNSRGGNLLLLFPQKEKSHSRLDHIDLKYSLGVREMKIGFNSTDVRYRLVVKQIINFKPDVVVVEQAAKNLETFLLFLLRRCFGFKIFVWGHGKTFSSLDSRVAAWLKLQLAKKSDGFLVYTTEGRDFLVSNRVEIAKITVLNNSIDTAELIDNLNQVSSGEVQTLIKDHGLTPGKVGVFIGGVDASKEIQLVIDSSFELQRRIPDFRLLVIGEGSERERLQQKYKDSGVIFVGRKEGKEKATYLRVSTILMIPRGIGLVALDGISAKVPIVSLKGNFHGPESVYLIDGESVYFANSEEAFVEKCELLIRQSQNVLSEPNYQQIEYSVQEMAEAFFNAIA